MPTSLDAEFSKEFGVSLKAGEKSVRLMPTSNFILIVQARVEVDEPNADFSIPVALFIVSRGNADFRFVFVHTRQS